MAGQHVHPQLAREIIGKAIANAQRIDQLLRAIEEAEDRLAKVRKEINGYEQQVVAALNILQHKGDIAPLVKAAAILEHAEPILRNCQNALNGFIAELDKRLRERHEIVATLSKLGKQGPSIK